ncbi:MFS transporter, FHS family, L-fucose permease [Chitinophaga terrae (ex Kim and Jung 2007)]|uniref:MFS transporter, FHS family, L-fucose permease n=1 Tax=Chitinophaga terrae (ex Kim and Jung 2007) TaxID=408074 RepID=A0A1H3ZGG1_9BACT|nr:L-fucose:H+ symporter permease [Chitinophaga terrae (ex Kim and Jung 2007)]MDQ0109777.1 FHS family L-fucose permease-like MFS transporter [Chitinophaga terrae (ex Kim and Jung 2007)]GEP88725.1 L-fucose:H+ symporter permease [Chitinophaga terrae (ex Kim and Jung 2007)]SEA22412.1 MFS transporter, FHS family, L-fucose permease [Chitinophaga terrae (ex Kim and Jung 2007)]
MISPESLEQDTTSTSSAKSSAHLAKFTEKKYLVTLAFVTSLFMCWGIALTMGDVLNRHFQSVLGLTKAQSGLVQFSIFGAYAIMAIPAGIFIKKVGYKNGVLLGLTLYALGAFLFVPAANASSFGIFRIALFVLACGMATLETVAHPFMAALGDQRTSDQRINFAQSFNAVGAFVGPMMGSYFLLRERSEAATDSLGAVKQLYIWIGVAIAAIAIAFALVKVPPVKDPHDEDQPLEKTEADTKSLFAHKNFVWAVVAQFFNVAAQAGTWAFFINYGHEKMNYTDEKAGKLFSVFMLMMLLGRFVGTSLMKFISPNRLLAAFALGNVLMCLIVAQGWGMISFIALLMINFFFSIMYPTIFSLGLKDLGPKTRQASSFIVMGMFGGAVFPLIMGHIADTNIATAYYLPIICYIVIFLYGARLYKLR